MMFARNVASGNGVVRMFQVGSAAEGRAAVAASVDLVVAQGAEADGHGRAKVGLLLLPLLPTVVQVVAPTPVLAAGGIVDGRGLAAALAPDAAGVVVGTRFVASAASEAHPDYKRRWVEARETDTVVSNQRRVEWSPDAQYRLLQSAITDGAAPSSASVARVRRGGQLVDLPLWPQRSTARLS